jgi:ABC-type transport system involved in multi-copper enzyme maturation permease subunit
MENIIKISLLETKRIIKNWIFISMIVMSILLTLIGFVFENEGYNVFKIAIIITTTFFTWILFISSTRIFSDDFRLGTSTFLFIFDKSRYKLILTKLVAAFNVSVFLGIINIFVIIMYALILNENIDNSFLNIYVLHLVIVYILNGLLFFSSACFTSSLTQNFVASISVNIFLKFILSNFLFILSAKSSFVNKYKFKIPFFKVEEIFGLSYKIISVDIFICFLTIVLFIALSIIVLKKRDLA